MKTPKLTLDQFAYRFSLPRGDDWSSKAVTMLGKQLGLPGEPWGGLGFIGSETKQAVEVGLDVLGVAKATPNGYPASAFVISGAAFTKKGQLVGWTTDHDESYPDLAPAPTSGPSTGARARRK